jgi:hypothetical protein
MANPEIVLIGIVALLAMMFALIRREIREAQKETLAGIREMIRKGHGYSDPSAAAAVTPSPSPGPVGVVSTPAPSHARVMLVPSAPSSGGISRPFRPSAEQVALARAAYEETAPRSGGASESPQALRARLEAEADARDRERVRRNAAATEVAARAVAKVDGLDVDDVRATVEIPQEDLPLSEVEPSPGDRASDATSVFTAEDRTTVFGMAPFAGIALEPPTPSAARTANASRKANPSSRTLVSAGVVVPLTVRVDMDLSTDETARVEAYAAERGIDFETAVYRLATTGLDTMGPASERRLAALTTPPDAPANDAPRETPSPKPLRVEAPMDPRVKARWLALVAQAQADGKPAYHCNGAWCVLDACACQCDGCDFIAALLRKAKKAPD